MGCGKDVVQSKGGEGLTSDEFASGLPSLSYLLFTRSRRYQWY